MAEGVRRARSACPICGGAEIETLVSIRDVPTQDVVLFRAAAAARRVARGRIDLSLCLHCAFVFNRSFDPATQRFGKDYESTQSHSPAFGAFENRLAAELCARHGLTGAKVVEIGCGQGEFLARLRRAGVGTAVGFDPAYDRARSALRGDRRIRVRRRRFRGESVAADFAVCKMTLEHVANPLGLVAAFGAIGRRGCPAGLFVQVPNAAEIFARRAFWDVYYEHRSYFTAETLARLLRHAGYDVRRQRLAFRRQYLLVDAAKRWDGRSGGSFAARAAEIARARSFGRACAAAIVRWRRRIASFAARGRTIMLWGGGSKAVAFLSAVGGGDIAAAIDVNPRKWGTYLPGSGLPVIGPAAAAAAAPDTILILNPRYVREIRAMCRRRSIRARLMTVAP